MSSKSKHRPQNKPPQGKLEKLLEKLPQPAPRGPVQVTFSDQELLWLDQLLAQVQVRGDGVMHCFRLRQKVAYLLNGLRQESDPAAAPPAPAAPTQPAPAQEPPAAATA